MTVAQNAIGQNEKPAPIRVRPGLWINITRPGYYMGNPPEVSRKEFDHLFHNNASVKPLRWDSKSLSARSCGLRLKWHRDDANSSLIFDDNNRLVAGEADSLEPDEEINWSCDKSARAGDLSLFYRTAPAMDIRYLLLVKGNAEDRTESEPGRVWPTGCDCVVAYKFQEPLPLKDIQKTGVRIRQATAIPVDAVDWRRLNKMLAERNPSYPEKIRDKFGVDIFAGIPLSVPASPATDENALADSLDSWAASPATYERLTRPEQRKVSGEGNSRLRWILRHYWRVLQCRSGGGAFTGARPHATQPRQRWRSVAH